MHPKNDNDTNYVLTSELDKTIETGSESWKIIRPEPHEIFPSITVDEHIST